MLELSYRKALFGKRLFLDGRSDVAFAYSFRRLRAAYTGPLIRLRRSSDNAERDFGSAQLAVSAGGIADWAGGTSFVAKWYDQSGNTRDLSQSSASAQPQYSAAPFKFTFDGTNDVLATSTFTLNQPWSFNIVYRRVTAIASQQYVFDGLTLDTGHLARNVGGGATDNNMYAGTNFDSDNAVSMTPGVRGVVGGVFNGASSKMEINAATVASFTGNVGASNIDGLTLGNAGGVTSAFSNMEAQEWTGFSTAHSQAQLQGDNAAMRAAWAF